MQYINAHCHDFIKTPNVVGAIVNAAQKSDWKRILKLQSGNVYAAIGIHPWYVSNASDNWQQQLPDLLIQNPNALVGETGLDTMHVLDVRPGITDPASIKFRNENDLPVWKKVVLLQLETSEK